MSRQYKTHNIIDLVTNENSFEKTITVAGWTNTIRNHRNLLFIDLRDYTETLQCIIDKDSLPFEQAQNLTVESVISVSGKIIKRTQDAINKDIKTGQIELIVENIDILSKAQTLPYDFNILQDDHRTSEELRLKNRFLDLRRVKMQTRIKKRSEIIKYIREIMWEHGFMEMQTPLLTASSPEGAKDYLVPSTKHPGKFYALPQAPQVFKQLIMASGFDKYFQIAPCFRDEDSRADRLIGEFYQLDIEMAFVTKEMIFQMMEPIIQSIFKKFSTLPISEKFYKLTYQAAINMYSSDKPDLRNKLTCVDVSDLLKTAGCSIFQHNVKAIAVPITNKPSKSELKKLESWAKSNDMPGLGYILFHDNEKQGPLLKMLNDNGVDKLNHLITEAKEFMDSDSFVSRFYNSEGENISLQEKQNINSYTNGIVFFVSSDDLDMHVNMVRTKLGEYFDCINKDRYEFAWITDFPFYEQKDSIIDFSHNPFSMPTGGMETLNNTKDLLKITAEQYDIVCNGIELSSGAIRNHNPEILYKAFELIGYNKIEVEKRFGALIKAFSYGVPPHGGIAPGIDRIVMLLTGTENLRENILFPLNQQGEDLLLGAPS